MTKRINYSSYGKQVLLACVKEYANINENKRTDRRTTNEKENAWEALANMYADANVTKTAGSLLEKKHLEKKKHKNVDASDRKERFQTGGGPPPAVVPDHPKAQTVGDIFQSRFNPLPNPYDETRTAMIRHILLSYLIIAPL